MSSTLHRRAGRRAAHGRAAGQRSHRRHNARSVRAKARTALLIVAATVALVLLAGCGPVHLVANTNIPTPLVTKIPIAVALFIPKDFSEYVHKEERSSTDWRVELGRAQTEGITRLMNAMFERVVPVDSLAAGSALGSDVRAILEPSIEEYAFVTPRDAGSPFFAVSIKYRVNVYMPDGKLAESWGFTGYGTSPSQGVSSAPPLAAATALAMRDAGAKLAVEFREQAVLRGLVPDSATPDKLANPSQQTAPAAAPGDPAASGQGPLAPTPEPQGEQKAAPAQSQAEPQGTPVAMPNLPPAGASEEQEQAPPETETSLPTDTSVAVPAGIPEEAASETSDTESSQQQSEEPERPGPPRQ